MSGYFVCSHCSKGFSTSKARSCHVANRPSCLQAYVDWLESVPSLGPGANDNLSGLDPDFQDQDAVMDVILDDENGGVQLDDFHPIVHDSKGNDDPLQDPDATLSDSTSTHESYYSDVGESLADDDSASEYHEYFPEAGDIKIQHDPPFKTWREVQGVDPGSRFYPFDSEEDWELAGWLHHSGLSSTQINAFFRLKYVKAHPPPFRSAQMHRSYLRSIIFTGPTWKAQTVVPDQGTPSGPVQLIYRDVLQAIKYQLSRPVLSGHLDFAPRRCWNSHDTSQAERLYSEMSTGDWWWETQASLPAGSTVIPVILGFDSTCLTNFSGGKKAWPVYLSIGNIHSSIRNRPNNRAWMTVAYIPVTDFLDDDKIRTTLRNRLFHKCMRILLHPLIEPGHHGVYLSDPDGNTRDCYPRVAGLQCDLIEQWLTSCSTHLSSPVTIAEHIDMDSNSLKPFRTSQYVLDQIEDAKQDADPQDVLHYQRAAKRRGLNGVHEPFWKDLPGFQLETALCPDIMHGLIKCWYDHLFSWSLKIIGEEEYDRRLRALQPVVGYRRFAGGVKHLSQMTCRDHRELMRTHITLMSGCPGLSKKAMVNLRAFHDFAYLAQYNSHNDTTLGYLEDALKKFHLTKTEWIQLGVRETKGKTKAHMKIPKLYGTLVYPFHIRQMGSSCQFSTEIVESLHRRMAKEPYHRTNGRNYEVQMALRLDIDDRLAHLGEIIKVSSDWDRRAELNTALAHYSPQYRAMAIEHYLGTSEDNAPQFRRSGRLWLTHRPYLANVQLAAVATMYALPNLPDAVESYLRRTYQRGVNDDEERFAVSAVNVWKRLKIRAPNVQDEDLVTQAHTVEAVPPSDGLPYGRCHCVLVHYGSNAGHYGIEGYRVAQVRLIFQIFVRAGEFSGLNGLRLAYVQWFSEPVLATNREIKMFQVSRNDRNGIREGDIIPIDAISRFVQLVPIFGPSVNDQLTADNSMDIVRDYYVNCFADKEVYQAVW